MVEYLSHSAEQTEQIGYDFSATLRAGDFVAMYGDLGVGKTAFVRGAARRLAPGSRVQSPTYTIVNEYRGAVPMRHFDMYRIDSEDSLCSIGFFDMIDTGISFAEWCENISDFIPEAHVSVKIEKLDGDVNDRKITIEDHRQ